MNLENMKRIILKAIKKERRNNGERAEPSADNSTN